jgi:hypothetical protein
MRGLMVDDDEEEEEEEAVVRVDARRGRRMVDERVMVGSLRFEIFPFSCSFEYAVADCLLL